MTDKDTAHPGIGGPGKVTVRKIENTRDDLRIRDKTHESEPERRGPSKRDE
jgi:hypothetical protein